MQVTLPSGHTAEIRDQFLRGDRRAAHKAAQFTIGPDGERVMDMSFEDAVYGALIRQMVVSWTIPQPAPREAQTAELAENIIDGLPDDDYAALADALKPFFDRVMRTGKEQDGDAPKPAGTGTSSSDAALDGQVTPSGSPTLS